MARLVTLSDLMTRARTLSNTQNDPNVTDAELISLANRHLPKVYDALVDAGSPDYYSATTQISAVAGQTVYPLTVDFRNLMGVYVRLDSSGRRRRLSSMPSGALASYVAPTQSGTLLDVEYIPGCPTLTLTTDTFDGISGFEELVACLMARDIMIKRQDDPSVIMANIQDEKERIVLRGRSRDKSTPKRITNLNDDRSRDDWWWGGAGSRLSCYRLRGDNIELMEAAG